MTLDPSDIANAVQRQNASLPFSGVVMVSDHREVVFEQACGMANRAESIPNTIHTRFGIASGSKIFTSIAICQLAQKGLFSFDSRLTDCLEIPFPRFDPTVTVHHLLTHSSGIPDYFDEEIETDYAAVWADLPMYRVRSPRDYLPLFREKAMKFAPGERFSYCNSGFIVLGLIIEQHTGMAFADYVADQILGPIGMSDTGYFAADQLPDRTAYGYIEDDTTGSWKTNVFAIPIIGAPDGGAYTTARDMALFWSAFTEGRLLDGAVMSRLLHPHVDAPSQRPGRCYGYGIWLTRRDDNITSYYVTGWDPGVAFVSRLFPGREVLVTVIGNTKEPTFPLYHAVLQAIDAE